MQTITGRVRQRLRLLSTVQGASKNATSLSRGAMTAMKNIRTTAKMAMMMGEEQVAFSDKLDWISMTFGLRAI